MTQTGMPARRAAHQMLQQVTTEGRLMSELLGQGALDRLNPEDRATAQRLATQTLRALDKADRMLKPFLQKNPPIFVRNALRLGTVELIGGGAAHGVVNAYVEIVARNKRTQSLKGLVNAALRKVDAAGPEKWEKLPSVMPPWLRQPLVAAWGRKAMDRIEKAHLAGAPLDLSVKDDAAKVAAAVGGDLLATGSVRIQNAGQVAKLAGFVEGAWWVQDAAAALPVKLLGDVKGQRILDLCAAPGGKTLQLAAAGAQVTAVDVSETRMNRVRENLKRTGLQAESVVCDAFDFEGSDYDAILLDAPCSATGTIRRHPDLPHAKDGAEFGALIAQQEAMIDHALGMLKAGGTLVFCTCSLLPDEGEVQVEEALSRHAGLTTNRAALDRPGIDPTWITEEGGLRLRPDYWADIGGMDGFYMAALSKPA